MHFIKCFQWLTFENIPFPLLKNSPPKITFLLNPQQPLFRSIRRLPMAVSLISLISYPNSYMWGVMQRSHTVHGKKQFYLFQSYAHADIDHQIQALWYIQFFLTPLCIIAAESKFISRRCYLRCITYISWQEYNRKSWQAAM